MDEIQYSGYHPITIIRKLIKYVILILFAVIVVAVFYQVLMRYIFGSPPAWTEELSRFSLVWLIILSSSVCIRKSRHFNVDYITQMFSRRGLLVLNMFLTLLVVLFLSVVMYYGFLSMLRAFDTTSPAMQISMGYVQLIFPLGIGANLMEAIVLLVEMLKYGPDRLVSSENS
jgi:TRAP-type C4-dicarboxylate transport system permease small subunit